MSVRFNWCLLCAGAFLVGSLAILVPTRSAFAHASLLAAVPADGVTIFDPPKSFRLEFNEPVSPLAMRLVSPDGQIAALPDVHAENSIVTIAAPAMRFAFNASISAASSTMPPRARLMSQALGFIAASIFASTILRVSSVSGVRMTK